MKIFRFIITFAVLFSELQTAPVSAAIIYTELATKKLHFDDKLAQTFNFSINLKKYNHIWVVYRMDKGITPPAKIAPLFKPVKNLPRLKDILQDANTDFNRQFDFLPFDKKNELSVQVQNSDCLIAIKFFLQSGRPRLLQIEAKPPDAYFDQQNIPLFWLGTVNARQSFAFLKAIFQSEKHSELQRQLATALSFHDLPKSYYSFSQNILKSNFTEELKKAAIFGLGNFPEKRCLRLLTLISAKSVSLKLRKAAIQSIAQNRNAASRLVLRSLALKSENVNIRKEAIFWISQIGDETSVSTLLKILKHCKNREIRKYAIFAISQLPDDKGKMILKKITEKSPNPNLRETAIYWMGQTDEQKKLDLMIDLFNSKQN